MNKNLINFTDLIKKPEFTCLVKSGSLSVLFSLGRERNRYQIEFSKEKNNFSEYFYKDKSYILVKINPKDKKIIPVNLAIYIKDNNLITKNIELFESDFLEYTQYCLEYNKKDFEFIIDPNTNELYALINVDIK